MKARVLLIVALAVVLLVAGGVSAAPAAAGGAVVPFRATYVTYPTLVDSVEGVNELAIPGEGRGTHLGLSAFDADSWVDTTPWPDDPLIQTGEMTLTAANGAQLSGTFAGLARPTGATTVEFWGEFEISAGTGRFTGTTGTGTYRGTADMSVNQGILYFEGTLTK